MGQSGASFLDGRATSTEGYMTMNSTAAPGDEQVAETENYGPAAALRHLEAMGRGDGPLARAFRSALVRRPAGSLAIGSTFEGPDDSPAVRGE